MIPESTTPGRRVSWPALVAMVLVPLLVVGALIGLAGTSRASTGVQAAIVNLDQAVEINGQYTPLGRQLAAAMMEREGDNISWTLADAKNAKDGLATGRYAAVVTIPAEFSAAATSFSANDADEARKATIDVQVSANAPVTDAALAQEIAKLAQDTVNTMLTEGYLDGIYIGFNSVGEQFTTIVDAASQLADGATQLSDGTGEVSNGLTQVSDGMGLLADNATTLGDGGAQILAGTDQLVDGGREITSGGDALVAGGSTLASGSRELRDGIGELAAQVPQLVDGVGQLADGAEQLLGGIPAYTAGTKQVVGGVAELKGGIDQVIAGLDSGADPSGPGQDASELQQLVDGAGDLAAGASQLAAGAEGISGGLQQVDGTLQAFASGAAPAPGEVLGIADQITDAITAGFQCPVEDADTCALLAQTFAAGAGAGAAAGVNAGFQAGAGVGSAALNTADPATGATLLQGASQLAGGAAELSGGAGQLAAGVEQLATELPQQIAEQLAPLRDGLQQLSDGAGQLVTGAQPLVDNADVLAGGATELLGGMQQLDQQLAAMPAGVNQLSRGVSDFADGVTQYTDGVGQFVDGVGQYTGGVAELHEGLAQYVDGVGQYTDGVVSAADGVRELADGFVQLDEGAEQLADGLTTFATEMASGADQVPSYSPDQREALSAVVANPVSSSDELVSTNQVGLASLLLVAGLWLAGLASYVIARAVPSDVVSSRAPSIALWGRTIGLPVLLTAGLGAVFGVVGGVVLELSLGRTVGLVVLLAAIGAMFVLVNHALAAWLGNIGRGISVLLLVASVALGVTSAVPSWLASLAGVSPLQSGMELTRTWMASGSGLVGLTGAVLLAGAIALGLSYLAIASRRQLSADQFRRRLAAA